MRPFALACLLLLPLAGCTGDAPPPAMVMPPEQPAPPPPLSWGCATADVSAQPCLAPGPSGPFPANVLAAAAHPTDPDVVAVVVASWGAATGGLPTAVPMMMNAPRLAVAATGDRGATWGVAELPLALDAWTGAALFGWTPTGALLVAIMNGTLEPAFHVYRSEDRGVTWAMHGNAPPGYGGFVALDDGTLVAMTHHRGTLTASRSHDDGRSWWSTASFDEAPCDLAGPPTRTRLGIAVMCYPEPINHDDEVPYVVLLPDGLTGMWHLPPPTKSRTCQSDRVAEDAEGGLVVAIACGDRGLHAVRYQDGAWVRWPVPPLPDSCQDVAAVEGPFSDGSGRMHAIIECEGPDTWLCTRCPLDVYHATLGTDGPMVQVAALESFGHRALVASAGPGRLWLAGSDEDWNGAGRLQHG